jgi:transcriptional regulator with XRE-family HTH domain
MKHKSKTDFNHNKTVKLGEEIRQLRKAHSMTLSQLSDTCGCSVSFLSKIERNQARPSLTAMQEIAEALGASVGWFFQNDGPVPADERPYIVRHNHRRRLTYSQFEDTAYLGMEDHLLSASLDGELALGISRYSPGGNSGDDLYTHRGEEAGLLLEGELELALGDRTFRLKTGDSFSFPSNIPHTFRNPGDKEAVVVWANTPISLRP